MNNTLLLPANPLTELVALLEDQNTIKNDMVTKGSLVTYREGKLWIQEDKAKPLFTGYMPTDLCHAQIAEKLGIPAQYYKKMQLTHPELLEYNINLWLAKDEQIKYLLRTFKGGEDQEANIARAMLSDRFHILDNYDVLFTALQAIKDMGISVKITKAQVTDKRMYLHVTCPDVQLEAEALLREYMKENDAVGNGIVSGLSITNSEVGLGSFEISPRATIVKCNNGLMVKDESFRRVHLGSKMEVGNINWSDKTRNKNTELVMSQTQDAIKTFLSTDYLGKMVKSIYDAHEIKLDYPIDAVQHVCKELSITEENKRNILNHFLCDGDKRGSGIFQALTKEAQGMGADAQHELETAAFGILPKLKKFDKPFSTN